jgi:uncharacterized membrane protein YdbT with pleckstrin-like domain
VHPGGRPPLATLTAMSYPEDALAAHEKLVLNLHPHPWVLAGPAILLVLATAAGIAALGFAWPLPVVILIVVAIVVAAGWFLAKFAVWYSTYFVLTSDRVMAREGVFNQKSIEMPLENVNTVLSDQSVIERIMRIGDIEIESASKDGTQRFEDIRRPSDVRKEIYVQKEENENRKYDRMGEAAHHHQGGAGGGDSITDQINRLADLRDRGALSEGEFQSKKTELLNRL